MAAPKAELVRVDAPGAPGGGFLAQLSFDRFRTLRIRVGRGGEVRVRAPLGISRQTVLDHLASRADWIATHLTRLAARPAPLAPVYREGAALRHLGRSFRLRFAIDRAGPPAIEGDDLVLRFSRPPGEESVRRVVESWRLSQSRETFTRIVRALLPRFDALGVRRPAGLKVRVMTSRWGSCTRAGIITLNRRLLEAPPELIEYVAAHELCHLRHMGHDKRFYALLAAVLPDWKARREALRREPIL
jgi:predicted metal-dependent hydrolase